MPAVMPTEPCLFNWLVSLRLPGWWRKKFWESFGLTLKKSNIALIVVFSGRFRQIFLPPPPQSRVTWLLKPSWRRQWGCFCFSLVLHLFQAKICVSTLTMTLEQRVDTTWGLSLIFHPFFSCCVVRPVENVFPTPNWAKARHSALLSSDLTS